jgi:4-hydroxyphenylpyruvate dioxygenase
MNPCGLDGIAYVEFVSNTPAKLDALFKAFGFSKLMRHESKPVDLYRQGDITFLVNRDPASFAAKFGALHGPSICAMGWRVKNARTAHDVAVKRGARSYDEGSGELSGFIPLEKPERVASKGFTAIDHLTNNVEKGTMLKWAGFYKEVFGFEEIRYFDIRGVKTGLTSYALRSPCGKFCIPINEADEKKSQINEYLEEYKGPGIQHLAFLTSDLLASLKALDGSGIETLDMDDDYYREAFARLPHITEDKAEIKRRNVLVDGDEQGYLLQIFTKNLVGPIFIELIQRKNHASFGEGNFGALFRSIERDQQKRGVLD